MKDDFTKQAKARYDEILAQTEEMNKELKALKLFLQAKGVIEKAKRGRKKKGA